MTFNFNEFERALFKPRTKEIEVPLLKDFFAEGAPSVWKIKALTSEDLAQVSLAQERNKSVGTLLSALLSANAEDKAHAIKKAMGLTDENLPEDLVRRIEVLLLGSVDLDATNPQHRETVIKMAEHFAGTFMRLTNEIYQLSGEGPEMEGKP